MYKLRHGNLSDRHRNYLLNGDERGSFGKLADKWQFLINAPFETTDKCCEMMKKKPFDKFVRETGRYPYIGITQDEGFKRAHQYAHTGCNVYDGKTIKSQPMGFWTKQDVLRYVVENDLEITSLESSGPAACFAHSVHTWSQSLTDSNVWQPLTRINMISA